MMFSFLQPLGFLLALAIPALVWIYLKKSRSAEIQVSSTFLLEKLSKRPVISKRAEFPLRFFLELLAILALLFAASEPRWASDGGKLALILDNSLSMQARTNVSTSVAEGAETRFQAAQQEARGRISKAELDTTFALYSVGKTLVPLTAKAGQDALSAALAKQQIAELRPTLEQDNLAQLLSGTGGGSVNWCSYDKVILFTDHAFVQRDNSRTTSPQIATPQTVPLEIIKVGTPVPNLALEHAALGLEDGQQSLSAEVVVYGGTAVDAELSIQSEAGQRLAAQSLQLAPRERKQVKFRLQPQGKLLAEVRSRLAKYDALQADNATTLTPTGEGSKQTILLVSDSETGVKKLRALTTSSITPRQYEELSDSARDAYALTVFHRYLPDKLPQTAILAVLPPESHPLYGERASTDEAQITSADSRHPLTSYLQTAALGATQALVFSVPSWGQAVLNTASGPTLLAGDYRGRRVVISGLEIFPFEGRKTPAGTVLTLNLFSWLLGSEGLQAEVDRGEESNTFAANTLELPSRLSCSEDSKQQNDRDLWPYLALTALLFLLAEWGLRAAQARTAAGER